MLWVPMMADAPTLFFDVGGVLLTNGWDTAARRRVVEAFGLDPADFQTRHEMLKTAFETGRISLDAYVKRAVFYRERPFQPQDFIEFMFAQSQRLGDTLDWVDTLARTRKYRLFTFNNESRELQEYRVRKFGLAPLFHGFLTSCYLGQVKPDEGIYVSALGIAGCDAAQAIFIDDRAINVEPAHALGLRAVEFQGLDPLREFLQDCGVVA
jgi:putative hydrolase of the HAD superfamily